MSGPSCFDKLSTNGLSVQHWVGKDRVRTCLPNNGLLNKVKFYLIPVYLKSNFFVM